MSITNIKKRIAIFYDDKGVMLDKKAFSLTAKTFDYKGFSYNVYQDKATYTTVRRWYWDIELYHYNVNNPNPYLINKKCEPIMDAEMYNIQLKTKVARDLNDLSKGNWLSNLDFKTVMIILIVLVVGYFFLTGKLFTPKTP